jgi:hypothetical protein
VLKISVIESRSERRLISEGKLLAPQVTELRTASEKGQSGRSKPRDRPEELNGDQPGRRKRAAWVDERKGQIPLWRVCQTSCGNSPAEYQERSGDEEMKCLQQK